MNDIIVIGDIERDTFIIGEIVSTNGSQADVRILFNFSFLSKSSTYFHIINSLIININNLSIFDFFFLLFQYIYIFCINPII